MPLLAASIVTLAETDLVVSAWLTAVTVALLLALTAGAVYRPDAEIEPFVVDHVTAVFVEPLTLAVNCSVPEEETVAEVGETEIETAPVVAGVTVTLAEADLVVSA